MNAPPKPLPRAASVALLDWYRDHARDYPWRRTRDPYAVLVSEAMLQQTQVKTVLDGEYYSRWMRQFPDFLALAAASETQVLRAWEGLGYYSRARNLHHTAKLVVDNHCGHLPEQISAMTALPGIGQYTAAAVAAFAHDAVVAVVDTNATRVVARWINFRDPVDDRIGHDILQTVLVAMVPATGGREFNSAVMELGQHICLPRKPGCEACPVARWCRARAHQPESLPNKKPRRQTIQLEEHVIWYLHRKQVLLGQEHGRRRHGLWKLPERNARDLSALPVVYRSTYTITHHRVRLTVHLAKSAKIRPAETMVALSDLDTYPMPAPYRKAVAAVLALH